MSAAHSVYVGPYVETEAPVAAYAIVGDTLSQTHPTILIANHRCPLRRLDTDRLDGVMRADSAGEIEWFTTHYAAALDKLRDAGASVRIGWGVVGYWS